MCLSYSLPFPITPITFLRLTFSLPIISISLPGVAHSILQPCTICRIECPNWVPPYMTTALTQVLEIRETSFSSYLEIIHLFPTFCEIRPIKKKTFNYLKHVKFHWEREVYNIKKQIKQVGKDYFAICLTKGLLTENGKHHYCPSSPITHSEEHKWPVVSSSSAPTALSSTKQAGQRQGSFLVSTYLGLRPMCDVFSNYCTFYCNVIRPLLQDI